MNEELKDLDKKGILMNINSFFLKFSSLLTFCFPSFAITIQIDASAQKHRISPFIYGKNHGISDDPSKPTSDSIIRLYKDCGVKIIRLGGGNNQTKYNWRAKLSSHPDWFNNVYAHDWDFSAQEIQNKLPGVCGLFSFQLLGWVADNNENNWNDWQWGQQHQGTYPPREFNLAGGGNVNDDGTELLTEGDHNLYLKPWPAESTTAILDHWFADDGIGLDKKLFQYWNMDNEPDIWNGTHDDVMKDSVPWQTFIDNYIAVASSARRKFPNIKLVGPVTTNEWQWYNWNNSTLSINENGIIKKYIWLEYFIKLLAQEQSSSGVRLIDVFDFHFYPSMISADDIHNITQLHRIWFDTTYNYPKANGVKKIGPNGWNPDTTKEFIMERVRRWLNQYMGNDHGVTFGITECGAIYHGNASVNAVWYASHLGEFARQPDVEVFTPWEWYPGQYEVLHLFTRYMKANYVKTTSDLDSMLSAYSSINDSKDSMTIIFVNRDQSNKHSADVTVEGFNPIPGEIPLLQLKNLSGETFKSRSGNALQNSTLRVSGKNFSIDLPPLSVTAVILTSEGSQIRKTYSATKFNFDIRIIGNYLSIKSELNSPSSVSLFSINGTLLQKWDLKPEMNHCRFSLSEIPSGVYWVKAGRQRHRVILVRAK